MLTKFWQITHKQIDAQMEEEHHNPGNNHNNLVASLFLMNRFISQPQILKKITKSEQNTPTISQYRTQNQSDLTYISTYWNLYKTLGKPIEK